MSEQTVVLGWDGDGWWHGGAGRHVDRGLGDCCAGDEGLMCQEFGIRLAE